MSEHVDERWHTDTRDLGIFSVDGTAIVRVCENRVECCRMVDDHNACLDIEDPATTVPELVAVCKQSEAAMTKAFAELLHSNTASYLLLSRAQTALRAVLAKIGKT